MFRKIFVLIGVSLTLFAVACASARVMQSTEKTAVIQGRDASKADAMKNAEKRAAKMFGKFKQTKAPECVIGETSDMTHVGGGSEHGEGHDHWDCVIYVEKID